MAIQVQCRNCRKVLVAKDEFAGKRAKCPTCKAVIDLPPPAERSRATTAPAAAARQTSAAQPSPQRVGSPPRQTNAPPAAQRAVVTPPRMKARNPALLERELLATFRGNIQPVPVSWMYRIGILLAAAVMVLLPVAYLAIIALTGLAVYYHAAHHYTIMEAGRGARSSIFLVMVYLTPIISGVILVFFMLKPLFARNDASGRTRSLTRQGEPVLFAFVDRLCQAVGARPPARIEVDCQLNAAASLDHSRFGLFGRRLVLLIGTPLVAGLDAGQLAGVLAHEFGHFTQGAGLRLTYVVRSINLWFMRTVYERDAWDRALEEAANEWNFRVAWVLQIARIGVWLSRRVLWVLMMIGHAVSSFMMRQMEYHADAHEARLVGSDVFESTSRRLAVLGVAYQGALIGLNRLADQGTLPDDLSQLILITERHIPPEVLGKIERQIETGKTGWFDTHPATGPRITRAHGEADEAVFVDHRPASALFTDFKALARNTTWDMYRAYYGSRFQPSKMLPVEQILKPDGGAVQEEHPPIPLD